MGIATTATLVPGPRQLADGNPEGTVMGGVNNSAGVPEKIGFYGVTPIGRANLSLSTATTTQIVQALANLGLVNATT